MLQHKHWHPLKYQHALYTADGVWPKGFCCHTRAGHLLSSEQRCAGSGSWDAKLLDHVTLLNMVLWKSGIRQDYTLCLSIAKVGNTRVEELYFLCSHMPLWWSKFSTYHCPLATTRVNFSSRDVPPCSHTCISCQYSCHTTGVALYRGHSQVFNIVHKINWKLGVASVGTKLYYRHTSTYNTPIYSNS